VPEIPTVKDAQLEDEEGKHNSVKDQVSAVVDQSARVVACIAAVRPVRCVN